MRSIVFFNFKFRAPEAFFKMNLQNGRPNINILKIYMYNLSTKMGPEKKSQIHLRSRNHEGYLTLVLK